MLVVLMHHAHRREHYADDAEMVMVLGMVLESAVEDGIITRNPARSKKLKNPSKKKTVRNALERASVKQK